MVKLTTKPDPDKGMLNDTTVYAFTLNPKNELQGEPVMNLLQRSLRYEKTIKRIKKVMNSAGIEYSMHPELSTPDPIRVANLNNTFPRLHYHGWIKIKDLPLFYLWGYVRIIKQIGVVKIKPIDKPLKWREYVIKDRKTMLPLMKRLNLPYHLTNKTK